MVKEFECGNTLDSCMMLCFLDFGRREELLGLLFREIRRASRCYGVHILFTISYIAKGFIQKASKITQILTSSATSLEPHSDIYLTTKKCASPKQHV